MSEGQIEVAGQQPASWPGTAPPAPRPRATPGVYRRHRPESTALYEVVAQGQAARSGTISRLSSARLTMGVLRCGSRNTRDRSFSPTSIAGFYAVASPG